MQNAVVLTRTLIVIQATPDYVEQGYDLFIWEIEVIIDELVVMSAILCKDDRVDGHVNC